MKKMMSSINGREFTDTEALETVSRQVSSKISREFLNILLGLNFLVTAGINLSKWSSLPLYFQALNVILGLLSVVAAALQLAYKIGASSNATATNINISAAVFYMFATAVNLAIQGKSSQISSNQSL